MVSWWDQSQIACSDHYRHERVWKDVNLFNQTPVKSMVPHETDPYDPTDPN